MWQSSRGLRGSTDNLESRSPTLPPGCSKVPFSLGCGVTAKSGRGWEDDMGTLRTVTVPNVVITLESAPEPPTKMANHCFSFFNDHIWLLPLGD